MKIKNSLDLSISIVSYNTKELLIRCIKSIYKQTKGVKLEVIVVDNGSKDGTIKEILNIKYQISNIKLIQNKRNLFFTKANNQALEVARGKYFLILNSDTYFVDNSLKKMVDYMEKNPDVGACEGLEIYENNKLVPTASKFSNPLIDFYELSIVGSKFKNKKLIDSYRLVEYDRKDNFEIDVGCDAFLLVRKEIMDKIGGYDERFFLFYTENDLCLRIKKLGYRIVHVGNSKVMHRVSASTGKLGWRKMDLYYNDLLTYYKKHGFIVAGTALFLLLNIEEFILKLLKKND